MTEKEIIKIFDEMTHLCAHNYRNGNCGLCIINKFCSRPPINWNILDKQSVAEYISRKVGDEKKGRI